MQAAISRSGPSFAEAFQGLGDIMGQAVTAGIAGAVEGAKQDLRRQFQAGTIAGRAANAIRSAVYPKSPQFSPSAAGTVFAAGDSADRFFGAFASGVTVVPHKGRALAIPLHNFRGFDRKLIGPNSSFWGGKLVFIPSKHRGQGTIGILASKADQFSSGPRWSRGSRRRRAASKGVEANLIPQFILVAVARLPKLLSPEETMANWHNRLGDLVAQAAEVLDK